MIESPYRTITSTVADAIAVVTLANDAKRNALSIETMRELTDALDRLDREFDVRAIVLRATGSVFSAGHDLREMIDRDAAAYDEIFETCVRLMDRIQSVAVPVIAEVRGVATAAGCQLVATCDLAIASSEAKFATPGVKIGLFCSTPMVALTRAIGRKRAMEMLLTGAFIDAATAADWGLVNRVVAPEELEGSVMALARTIAGSSPATVGLGKAAFYAQIDLDQHAAYVHTKAVMARNAAAPDAQEGMGAFVERRTPVWTESREAGSITSRP